MAVRQRWRPATKTATRTAVMTWCWCSYVEEDSRCRRRRRRRISQCRRKLTHSLCHAATTVRTAGQGRGLSWLAGVSAECVCRVCVGKRAFCPSVNRLHTAVLGLALQSQTKPCKYTMRNDVSGHRPLYCARSLARWASW